MGKFRGFALIEGTPGVLNKQRLAVSKWTAMMTL